ncbi:MAG: hypothetical protein A3F33_01680 [Candidatus Woykebacteria bacterium RIFCSPHIGHO2_12_FULL_43_10]|uniref:SUF system FeS cluster assembly SufBD core domain-containing protein n=2 Tax=Candidatus Woykeibacteriota TaxID=1817899 RepID=A0A1G1WV55_9BACT|nr:MAG: hypothetical protein A2802_02340 [Candidatus Woykebacteria bacterium RIFCSPHIGHO2_01_FULL_43_29]OGY29524.1 MAG: hypothetical protein A3F33_01680 [Candidatus Woykebacteria bacterium RIFCSPHIGHO2_12_FULL_43_10]OGY29623.1 MAG: hypothetical protein A3J50_00220 [Candidatus Woykebacteria bacterium RIFCSPHIGHO2_02_FULL_43_16b]OGY31638.1 MAG: hypothetical protein A3A61_00410 [Candidatus Woykebacteria bacterium RIFCSPLOWO2_01_FULL_43_14]
MNYLLTDAKDNLELRVTKNQKHYVLEKLLDYDKEVTSSTKIVIEENGEVYYFLLLSGGSQVSKSIEIVLKGDFSKATILGVYLGEKDQKYHLRVVSNHQGSDSRALTWINGVLYGQSSSNFDGMVKIDSGLHRVNSYLANHVLILGDEASANAIPSLEIESDDVKCSHEATVGQVGDAEMFYLQSRGLTADQAEKLLTQGFFESVTSKIENKEFRLKVSEFMERNSKDVISNKITQ